MWGLIQRFDAVPFSLSSWALALFVPLSGGLACTTSGESGSRVSTVDSEAQTNRSEDDAPPSNAGGAAAHSTAAGEDDDVAEDGPEKVSVPEGFRFEAAKQEALPSCSGGTLEPTYPGGAWSVADLRCAKDQIGDQPFKLRGVIVLADRCHCDEGAVCGPCVDAHWVADSLEPGPYVLIQAKYAEDWQLGQEVELQLKPYRWESPPLPVASTNWVE